MSPLNVPLAKFPRVFVLGLFLPACDPTSLCPGTIQYDVCRARGEARMKNAAGKEDQARPRIRAGSTRKSTSASFSLDNYAPVEPPDKFFFSMTIYLRDSTAPATVALPSTNVGVDFTPYFSTGRPLTKLLGGSVTIAESTVERLVASFSLLLGTSQTDADFRVDGDVVVDDCELKEMCTTY